MVLGLGIMSRFNWLLATRLRRCTFVLNTHRDHLKSGLKHTPLHWCLVCQITSTSLRHTFRQTFKTSLRFRPPFTRSHFTRMSAANGSAVPGDASEMTAKGKGKAVDQTPAQDMSMDEEDSSEEEEPVSLARDRYFTITY